MPDHTETRSDVAAALHAAEEPTRILLDLDTPHDPLVVAHRTDYQITKLDLERFADVPARARGTVKALTADGFVEAFRQRAGQPGDLSPASVYVQLDQMRLVAVLNDDIEADAGWRDHRIVFTPETTLEWHHWVGNANELGPQEWFARVIEDGETEIREPSATVMLDIAQSFQASTSAKFKKAARLRDGRTQLAYEEEVEASAGTDGLVTIPETFTIELRPFYGAEPVEVRCQLRFTVKSGELRIGYRIHRPEEILRASFVGDVAARVREELAGFRMYEASPDAPLAPGR